LNVEHRYSPPGRLSVPELLAASGGQLIAGPDLGTWALCTDTRELSDGAVFVALIGEHHDGHRFVADAVGTQACGALVARDRSADLALPEDLRGPVIAVDDTLVAFGAIAAAFFASFGARVAAITGSVGKTTTRAMLASILRQESEGLQTRGNFNNRIGLPLTLLRMRDDQRWAVLELGMSEPGELRMLARIAAPHVRVITEVTAAHLEFFPSVEAIADAKGELFEEARAGDLLVMPADNPLSQRFPTPEGCRCVFFSLDPSSQAQVRALHIEDLGRDGSRVRMLLHGEVLETTVPLAGRHQVHNALAAAAAAHGMGASPEAIAAGLARVEVPGRRMKIVDVGGVTVLDDAYNANPASVAAALQTLAALPTSGQRVAALGDMLELGPTAEQLHAEVGVQAAALGVDLLVGAGPLMNHAVIAARSAGIRAEAVTDSAAAGGVLLASLSPGDLLLLKGSRGMKMEAALEPLVAGTGRN